MRKTSKATQVTSLRKEGTRSSTRTGRPPTETQAIRTGDHLSSGVRMVACSTTTTGNTVARDVVAVGLKTSTNKGASPTREAEALMVSEEEVTEVPTLGKSMIGMTRTLMRGRPGKASGPSKTSTIMMEAWGGAFS